MAGGHSLVPTTTLLFASWAPIAFVTIMSHNSAVLSWVVPDVAGMELCLVCAVETMCSRKHSLIDQCMCLLSAVCVCFQVLLKQDNGDYACIAEDRVRYNLGDVKEELMAAMGLNTEEAGSTMAFLRRGYKTSTWFEDDSELEQHKDWRM